MATAAVSQNPPSPPGDLTAKLVTNGVMTGTAVVTGTALNLRDCSRASVVAVWTGTPNGSFAFRVNNHPTPILDDGSANPEAPAWTTLTLPAAFAAGNPSGAAGNFDFQFSEMGEQWLQPVYTNSSSTGTLNIWASGKA